MRKLVYQAQFDGLRAVSALLVLAFHSGIPYMRHGRVGVSVFFVLSGYLITRMLLNGVDTRDFYERRARRLVPGYIAFLIIVLAAAPFVFPEWNALPSFFWSLFYVSDYAGAYFGTNDALGHTWSLAIEMQFYLFWPFVVRYGNTRWLFGLLIATVILRFGGYLITEHWRGTYMTLHGNSVGLIAGAILATYKDQIKPRSSLAWLGLFVILASAVSTTRLVGTHTLVAMTSAEIGAVALIAGTGLVHQLLSARPLVWLGERSYGFYLWHVPIIMAVQPYIGWGWAAFWVTAVAAAAVAALSYRYIEQPFRRAKASPYGSYLKRTSIWRKTRSTVPLEPL